LVRGDTNQGVRTLRGQSKAVFDKSTLSWYYRNLTVLEYTKKYGSFDKMGEHDLSSFYRSSLIGTGHFNIFGQNYLSTIDGPQILLHENVHMFFRRSNSDSYLNLIFGNFGFNYDSLDRRLAWKLSGVKDGM